MQLNPYIFFKGECAEAFSFYEQVLGGKIEMMLPHAGSPVAEHVPPEWQEKILHARLNVDGYVLMASDAPPERQSAREGFAVNITVDDAERAVRIFNSLSEGGNVIMPYGPTFWAAGFGMCTDRYGIEWMINCENTEEGLGGR